MSMFNRVRETQEIRAAMWPPGGKSEEDARTANAEKAHAGDYAAACRRIAQLEIALQDVEDQHADLKHAYDLAQGTAEVLASKHMDVAKTEHFLQMNRQFGTDPATEAFYAGRTHLKRRAGIGRQSKANATKEAIMAWLDQNWNNFRFTTDRQKEIHKIFPVELETAKKYCGEWKKKRLK